MAYMCDWSSVSNRTRLRTKSRALFILRQDVLKVFCELKGNVYSTASSEGLWLIGPFSAETNVRPASLASNIMVCLDCGHCQDFRISLS